MQCKDLPFDLDGTLVDSLPVVERSWCKWGDRFTIGHDEILGLIHGKQTITSTRHFVSGRSKGDAQIEFRFLKQVEATGIEDIATLPGVLTLPSTLNRVGIPWTIVTSGLVPIVHVCHRAAGLPMLEVFITAEQVKYGKPAPDAYLLGTKRLGLPVDQCAMIEDASTGLLSDLAVGCRVIVVSMSANVLRLDETDPVLSNLDDLVIERQAGGYINMRLKA